MEKKFIIMVNSWMQWPVTGQSSLAGELTKGKQISLAQLLLRESEKLKRQKWAVMLLEGEWHSHQRNWEIGKTEKRRRQKKKQDIKTVRVREKILRVWNCKINKQSHKRGLSDSLMVSLWCFIYAV